MTAPHAPSWYAASATPFAPLPRFEGPKRVDVAILGAGLTGLSAALELARRGYTVAVLEAERVGYGASGRSGGQLIFGYGCETDTLARLLDPAHARLLFDWSVEGVAMIAERVREFGIDCDLASGHAHAAIRPRQVEELKRWQGELERRYDYGGLRFWDRAAAQQQLSSERYAALLFDPRSGHLHPLNYTLGLARAALGLGVQVYEGSRVTAIRRGPTIEFGTARGMLSASHAVLAGNALLGELVPELAAKIMPVGTYISATAALPVERAAGLIRNHMAVADINFVLDYFRLARETPAEGGGERQRLLFGGRVSYTGLTPPALAARMRQRMLAVFPQLADVAMEYTWGGLVDITMNRAPHWGRVAPNLYFAQGFSGHGIAATGLAGRVLAEAIAGQAERLDVYQRIRHAGFPGGRMLRTPALALAMLWYRLKDLLP